MNRKLCLFIAALLLPAGAAFSQDYGLTLRSLPVFTGGPYGDVDAEFTGTAVPWFATPLGEQGDLYLSGGISADYAAEEWKPVFELYRFEIAWRFDSGLHLEAGRLPYREPLNLVLNGLFDGFALSVDLGKTRLSGGAFYTGLLYKKAAWITMSPADYADYYDGDVYFASRRLVLSVLQETPAFFNTEGKLDAGLVAQFDLNKPDDQVKGTIHSQYALAKFALPFQDYFNAELGALMGMTEETGRDPGFCFALSGGLAWLPPGAVNDRLSLNMALSSGAWSDGTRAFLPVNTIPQGKVLRPNLSGLALVEAGYTARVHRSFSAEASAAYFFRTDAHTYGDPDLDTASRSPLLGGEIYGGLTWAPVSDVSASLGGGAFFPRMGRSFATDADPRWRISLETILSF